MFFLIIRALKALPLLGSKRQCVIYRLASSFCPKLLKRPETQQKPNCLSTEVRDSVTTFYLREDVSLTMPGHGDTIVVREGGVKCTLQKRFLMTSLKEAYATFTTEHGKTTSLSSFCNMRPKNVLSFGDIPHNVCACRTHEDFIS